MKTHVNKSGLEENQWKIYVTDENLDTYVATFESEEYPSKGVIINQFKTNRGSFKLLVDSLDEKS